MPHTRDAKVTKEKGGNSEGAERRQNVAHVARPRGAKDLREGHVVLGLCRPWRGLNFLRTWSHGLRHGLSSNAAPQLTLNARCINGCPPS